jgi:hypothetical protein
VHSQRYDNHAHRPTATTVAGIFAIFGLAFAFVYGLNDGPWLLVLALVSLALAVSTLVVISRTYTVRLQNRIIRLEMQLRMDRLGLGRQFALLRPAQWTALRFASDAELPTLTERALSEGLTSDQIKRAVTDWQGDYFRT